MLGKTRQRRRGWQRMRGLDSITGSGDRDLSKLREAVEDRGVWQTLADRGGQGSLACCDPWGHKESDMT